MPWGILDDEDTYWNSFDVYDEDEYDDDYDDCDCMGCRAL